MSLSMIVTARSARLVLAIATRRAELDHLGQLLVLRRAARERDGGRDRDRAEHRAGEGRDERDDPHPELVGVDEVDADVEDGQRHGRRGHEVDQVECHLERRLARPDERNEGPGHESQQVVGRRECEQSDHRRELAQ